MTASNNYSNTLLFLVVIVLPCFARGGRFGSLDSSAPLLVPRSKFVSTVGSTIGMVKHVMTTVSKRIPRETNDFRLVNAVADCLDLMDLSVELLDSTLAASQGKHTSTGNVSADMKCWLSGALFNQDTCKEGFVGTKTDVGSLISGGLDQVTSLVENLLSMVKPIPTTTNQRGFPDWFNPHDKKHLLATTNDTILLTILLTANATVAKDGTGNFTSIQEAIDAVPEKSRESFVIYIKRGVYNEYVEINQKKWNVMLIGDGMDATVISGSRNNFDGWTTFHSATFGVNGQGFIARDITFENTAGPEKHQAVAFRSDSDLSVLYRCAFRGFQDTLYPHSMRQFYRECVITGTVDFIFGDGTVIFQNCEITARKGLPNQKNTITAQGRQNQSEPSGFSIQFCNISSESSGPTYLGRPWKLYSRTVIMQSNISEAIAPEGWLEWDGNFAVESLYYGEYMNYGPGAGLGGRVNWPGFHVINDSGQAYNFTVGQFLGGNDWLPSTGVQFIAGLGTNC